MEISISEEAIQEGFHETKTQIRNHYCESEETIQFVGPQDSKGLQMEYRYGFGRVCK